ncbi:MAG: hypothetical protein AABX11_03510 [Nanoarchaeota archaeon]
MGRYTGYTWVYSPKAQKMDEKLKTEINFKSEEVVKVLKKGYLKKIPDKLKHNQIIDIYTKWIQNRFYFCSKYICPKDAAFPSFETRFARLEYTGVRFGNKKNFQLFFMRHTGEWIKILEDKTLNECLKGITEMPYFVP